MAIKTVHIDDLDGTPLSGNSTTRFSLNGVEYEIDLAPANAAKLKAALAPFIKAGRRVGAPAAKAAPRRRGGGRHSNGAKDVTAIREWARANGHSVGDRGRIPASILEAYANRTA
ncbi:MAG: hypothetical protein BGO95_05940 [Micrococcales bacterium 73-13]|nr:MAG: hypothetical protein BGO95_05940 [Micrococcales bacterium 73-13]